MKIKLTKKNRQIICELLRPKTNIEPSPFGDKVIKPYENIKQHEVNHFLIKKNNITQEMIDNFNIL